MSPPPRPHPLARSRLVDKACGWLESAWKSGVASRPSLDPDILWTKALAKSPARGEAGGRSEEDVADFRLRLEKLSNALTQEANLNALGLTIAHGQLVRAIRQRLDLGALWLDRPDLPTRQIAPPIIVVGQMRSGTTRVHRLLAADPALSATRFCDSWHPCPRKPDTRPLWSAFSLLVARQLDPWLDSIHPFGATRPDEELGWLACALDHCAYEAQWHIPSFTRFSEGRESLPLYREFARILRTDAASRGNAAQPRVLKVPQFAEDLPILLAQFPDARVLRTQREAGEIASSAASLMANQMTLQSDHVSMNWIEAESLRKIALRERRMTTALADFDGPLASLDFTALDADWVSVMRQAYATLGLQLTPEALDAMRVEDGRADASIHRAHRLQRRRFARA